MKLFYTIFIFLALCAGTLYILNQRAQIKESTELKVDTTIIDYVLRDSIDESFIRECFAPAETGVQTMAALLKKEVVEPYITTERKNISRRSYKGHYHHSTINVEKEVEGYNVFWFYDYERNVDVAFIVQTALFDKYKVGSNFIIEHYNNYEKTGEEHYLLYVGDYPIINMDF